jgi:hypothetical protein
MRVSIDSGDILRLSHVYDAEPTLHNAISCYYTHAMLGQYCVLHASLGGSQEKTKLLIQLFSRSSFEVCCYHS